MKQMVKEIMDKVEYSGNAANGYEYAFEDEEMQGPYDSLEDATFYSFMDAMDRVENTIENMR